MPEEKFLLLNTPTASQRVIAHNDQSETFTLISETKFDFTHYDVMSLTFFFEAVKADKTVRHTFSPRGDAYQFEYDLVKFTITRTDNRREIVMGMTAMLRFLNALTGNTKGLIKED